MEASLLLSLSFFSALFQSSEEMMSVQCRSNSGSDIAVPMQRQRGPDAAAAWSRCGSSVDPTDEAAWIHWRRRRSDSDRVDLAVVTQSSSDSSDPNGD
ncbi:hypothetical protein GUJ93_ZPchr0009g545 [Zizania palustris]|uniref:Secreted protein n=1 Tax=Zizania palustris TaxID=103762 RepID=A0A8J5R1M7_ZIZPA|nr:hypothetical protein GUJ93_ZPchr0009g545 [Zizania palustris]